MATVCLRGSIFYVDAFAKWHRILPLRGVMRVTACYFGGSILRGIVCDDLRGNTNSASKGTIPSTRQLRSTMQ